MPYQTTIEHKRSVVNWYDDVHKALWCHKHMTIQLECRLFIKILFQFSRYISNVKLEDRGPRAAFLDNF